MVLESVEDALPFPVQQQPERSYGTGDKVVSPSGRYSERSRISVTAWSPIKGA